jgi:hypothetical protein
MSFSLKKVIDEWKLVEDVTQKYEEEKINKNPWMNQPIYHPNKLGFMI